MSCPTYIINLESRPERRKVAVDRVRAVGYENPTVLKAIEPKTVDFFSDIHRRRLPEIPHKESELGTGKAKAACRLSHLNALMSGLISGAPFFTVFEDDVKFHTNFTNLAPMFFNRTPLFDMVYLGGKIWWIDPRDDLVLQVPVMTTHAMMFSRGGARQVYDLICRAPLRAITVDLNLVRAQEESIFGKEKNLDWYLWNASSMADSWTTTLSDECKSRCAGLVYQDPVFGSDIWPEGVA